MAAVVCLRLKRRKEKDKNEIETGPGFIVVIEGYSPYENIGELMDPIRVGKDQSEWGFVTRLENLHFVDNKERFLLYGKGDTKHFKQETGYVNIGDKNMPEGIGVLKEVDRVPQEYLLLDNTKTGRRTARTVNRRAGVTRITTEEVLIDPMTNEEMSRVFDIKTKEDLLENPELTKNDIGVIKIDSQGNQKFIEKDHWFRISAKFRWMGAPEVDNKSSNSSRR